MSSSDLEFQFDNKRVQQNSSIAEGYTKSVMQQKILLTKEGTDSSNEENLLSVDKSDTRGRKQSQSNDKVAYNAAEVSILGGGRDEDEEGGSSSNQHPKSLNTDPIPPPLRRDAEEVATMIIELRALVSQLKESTLTLAPVVSVPVAEAEVQVGSRPPDTSVTLTAAAAAATADILGSDTNPAPESPEDLVPSSPSLLSPTVDIDDGIVIGSDNTSSEAPMHSEASTTTITTTAHPDPDPDPLKSITAEDILTQTLVSTPREDVDYDLFTAIGAVDPPPSSLPSSPPITSTPAPANVKAQVPLLLPLPSPTPPTYPAAEVDLSGT